MGTYSDAERPPSAGTDRVFVVLKGPRRGQPLSAKGVEVVLPAARCRAGLGHATCHEPDRLDPVGRPGWRWRRCRPRPGTPRTESTRIHLHLPDDWLAAQYRKAAEVTDAQVFAGLPAVSGRRR